VISRSSRGGKNSGMAASTTPAWPARAWSISRITAPNRSPIRRVRPPSNQQGARTSCENESRPPRKIRSGLARRIEKNYSKDKISKRLSQRNLFASCIRHSSGSLLFRTRGTSSPWPTPLSAAAEDAGDPAIRCVPATAPSSARNYVIDRLQENGCDQAGRCREGAQAPLAVTSRSNDANFAGEYFDRGSPSRHLRALWEKKLLRAVSPSAPRIDRSFRSGAQTMVAGLVIMTSSGLCVVRWSKIDISATGGTSPR